ncbi:Prolyl endopeptidase [Rickettsia parkeri]|nr:Prolyl endopeptidase [Rickettsia parkeri]
MENEVWVKHGGVSVLANIRGGGEFGPEWHKATQGIKRQTGLNDFIAVAEDLIKQNITSPEYLGIKGGSNGGLLVSVAITQRPDLFGAIACEVPILDTI